MEFEITNWTIDKLYKTFKDKRLDLSPPYQRNFIWSTEDQQTLIDSISRKIPIPNFFLLNKGEEKYEMVDGQQRSRTIINFIDRGFKDFRGHYFSVDTHADFLKFSFPVTIITDTANEDITKFYALVNKTGVHLNKPEVRKADFYNTNLLKLVDELADSRKLKSLKLFTDKTLKRMNDKEFISELLILIKDGHVDKKGQIDEYFKKDLTEDDCILLKRNFNSIIEKISLLNSVFPINKSRFKQRNDFYTLVDFIINYKEYNEDEFVYFFKLLILISSDIKPTQDKCEALKEYARNCVTQSNSKLARENRLKFFQNLLLNKKEKPNAVQSQIMDFYDYKSKKLKVIFKYHTINISELSLKKEIDFLK